VNWRSIKLRARSPEAKPVPAPEPPLAAARTDGPAGPAVIETLADLDAALRKLDAAAAISDDELRRAFETFSMRFPLDLPADPDSAEYRARQFELYEWLHGKPYSTANEVSAFDPLEAANAPFPYHTKSAQTVGNQLIAIGYLIRALDLPPGSRVLEFGPGWGNTTIALARMGCLVTAVDIEPNFLKLIDERARRKHVTIETIRGDFSLVTSLDRQFDAVLFFECFHHCSDHQALIAALDRVVAPGGKVVFAGEPIDDGFALPWGLRLDAHGGPTVPFTRHTFVFESPRVTLYQVQPVGFEGGLGLSLVR
jgi:2-polyprenyl-3-methyl-5-hydroxy-6-metoxy-1,4-benzoquinol methylase